MHLRLRTFVAALALLIGLAVTPIVSALPVSAQDNTGRTISLDVFRCPPGVPLQEMVAADCTSITSGVDVIVTSINGTIAPLTISDATLDGNTFRWDTTASGNATDEWGFKRSTLPEGTSAFLVQGEGVVPGQSGAFDYRFTTSAANPAASLDMYLLMSADAAVIEPPSDSTAAEPAEVTPEATAGPRPSPTATTAAADEASAPVESASTDDSSDVAPADIGDVFVPGDEVVVFDGPVNLRATAGTGGTILQELPQGTVLTVLAGPTAADGYNWYQVQTAAAQTGWVAVDFIELVAGPDNDFDVGDQVVVFDGPVNLRVAAGTSAAILQSLPQDTLLTILGGPTTADGYAWYQVQTAAAVSGWVAADFIELVDVPNPPDGDLAVGDHAVVIDGPVNLRSAAGINNSIVAVLNNGDTMTVTGGPTSADGYTWWQVQTGAAQSGWIAGDFIEQVGFANGDVVVVNTDSLNVRSAAGLNAPIVGTIYQGTVAVITGGPTNADNRDWYSIDVTGVISGWVAGEYLTLSDAPPVNPPSGNYGAGDWIFVNDPPLNLRSTPSTSGQILASLTDGDAMLVMGDGTMADGYTWNQVQKDALTGYVATEYVNGGFALGEFAVVADGPVNLRSAPGTGSSILQSLAQGAEVNVLNVNPQNVDGIYWFQVTTTDAVTGWVAGRYLGPVVAAG